MVKRKLIILALAAIGFVLQGNATEYVGTMSLASGYTLDNVHVSLDEQGNMTLYSVKFARMMPVRVDVLIPQVTCNNERISGENIIPSVSGKPHPDRIVTQLQGTANKQALDFRCLMGGKEMHYKGKVCKR